MSRRPVRYRGENRYDLYTIILSFLQIGLFSVGGGYAAIPLVQSLIVERQGWITMTEFTNLITIAEMTPGPIAVNSATFVGIRIAGLPGAVAATWGCIFPSCIIVRYWHTYIGVTVAALRWEVF